MAEENELSTEELIAIYRNQPPAEVRKKIRSEIYDSIYWDNWENQANLDFHFPITAFNLMGESNLVPFERYLYISKLFEKEHLAYLNKICRHWDLENEQIEFNPDLSDEYSEMTEKEWNQIASDMEDSLDDNFTISNHLILYSTGSWSHFIPTQSGNDKRVSAKDDLRSLVRGYKDHPVTYRDILTASRNFFRTEAGHIEDYTFGNFSREGYPILSVDIFW